MQMKLMMVSLLVLACGARAMEYDHEEGLEMFGDLLYIENGTREPITLKWNVLEQGDWKRPQPLNSGARQVLGPITAIEFFAFAPFGTEKWNNVSRDVLAPMYRKSGRDIVLRIRHADGGYKLEPVAELMQEQKGGFAQEEKITPGMAFLNFFPRVEAKLLNTYGERLKSANIRDVERLIGENRSITPSDFLDLPAQYTQDDVNCAYEALEDRIEETQETKEVKSAARRQLRYARDAALEQVR